MRCFRSRAALLFALLVVTPTPAGAIPLGYDGTFELSLGALPSFEFEFTDPRGVSVTSGVGAFTLPSQVFSATKILASSLFTGIPSIDGLTFTVANDSGSFNGPSGLMPLSGFANVTLIAGLFTLNIPLDGVGAGGPVNPVYPTGCTVGSYSQSQSLCNNTTMAPYFGLEVTVTNAALTTGTARVTGVTTPSAGGGFTNTATLKGYDNRDAAHVGVIQYVSPTRILTNVAGALATFTKIKFSFSEPVCGDGRVDPGEQCDGGIGVVGDCCTDACSFESSGNVCDDGTACTQADFCDAAGLCVGQDPVVCVPSDQCFASTCNPGTGLCSESALQNGTPCSDGDVCTIQDACQVGVCTGNPNTCGDGTVQGACGETCDDGNSTGGDCCGSTCQIEPVGTVCRSAAFSCDAVETCDGSDSCPADLFLPDTVECRPAAGECDEADFCSGISPFCLFDEKRTDECRPSADACDEAESCNGVSNVCPADGALPAGTECRAPADACDASESCDGQSLACPSDGAAPDGTECADVNLCDGTEVCQSGTCTDTEALDCDDGDPCTADGCDEFSGCRNDEILGCAPLDHFSFYRTRGGAGNPDFASFGPVALGDRFGSANYDVLRPLTLGLPANKNGEGVADEVTHLREYQLRLSSGSADFERRSVRAVNQCNDFVVDLRKPASVLLPANKDLVAPVAAPVQSEHSLNHFLCYEAALQRRVRFPRGFQVDVIDQFQSRRYDLVKVTKVCTPASKSGSPVVLRGSGAGSPFPIEAASQRAPDQDLVCYKIRLSRRDIPQDGCGPADPSDRGSRIRPRQDRHVRRQGVFVNDQFGPEVLASRREREICIPSKIEVSIP